MSFSLSSLLNPEPAQSEQQRSPEQNRKSSPPPVQLVQSPEQHHATHSHSSPSQSHFAYPPVTAQEAAQALATLAHSDVPPPTHYYGYSAPEYTNTNTNTNTNGNDVRRQSIDHRSSSSSHGTGASPFELPPPTPTTARKPSSPTLEQYAVASRSPEQRRASIISPSMQPGFTLPPLKSFTSSGQEQVRRSEGVRSPEGVPHESTSVGQQVQAVAAEDSTSATNGHQVLETATQRPAVVQPEAAPPVAEKSVAIMAGPLDGTSSSPAPVKEEDVPTPRPSSPTEVRRSSIQNGDTETHTPKAISSLKHEHSVTIQSPLRESSVPVPSTEDMHAPDSAPSKKRPAPSRSKKGTATTSKRAPPSKKRKIDSKRSETPASRTSKAPGLKTAGSSIGTPANSSPAPSTRSHSAEADDEPYGDDEDVDEDEDVEGSGDVYCICRKPDNGTFMIGCDGTCDDWFHGKCVGIEERDKNLIDKYICPNCSNKSVGRTTWKRMCRRSGCRQPARVGKSKGGKDGSKYCSEECGVLYFREMVARTRNREDTVRQRGSRRKGSLAGSDRFAVEDDLGARGGAIAAGEVKSLITASKTAEDFKKLGEGVLSPPATPDGKDTGSSNNETEYTESETAALAKIREQKDEARRRHQLLKDRTKFVSMVKQAASRAATEKELKPKEYCGYDPRLEWTEEQFAAWRATAAGKQAFELETLAIEHSGAAEKRVENEAAGGGGEAGEVGGGGDSGDSDEAIYAQISICDRKKCARHLEWGKLSVDDVRFEMGDNSDRMRVLDREEREVKERAALRRKAGGNVNGEGSVEVHGLGIVGVQEGKVERDVEGDVDMGGTAERGGTEKNEEQKEEQNEAKTAPALALPVVEAEQPPAPAMEMEVEVEVPTADIGMAIDASA